MAVKKKADNDMRTLWRARLRVGTQKTEFLFREGSDFEQASATAVKLLVSSPAANMTGAEIEAVERAGRLWN